MLLSRRLDDQRFQEIVEQAEGRLPWLCPVWTDHNAHDPGITILELMAWYKETLQYRMDRITPELGRALLALAGQSLARERAAECMLELPESAPDYPLYSPLTSPEDVGFELAEAVPADRARLKKIMVANGQGDKGIDITNLVSGTTAFQPFSLGGLSDTFLLLGFSDKPSGELRLWFDVAEPEGIKRNPPDEWTEKPRVLVWEFSGAGEMEPERDDTWALSWSGFVTFPDVGGWTRGEDGLYWLKLSLTDPGCEESVRLLGISAGRYRATQQESRARSYGFRVANGPGQALEVKSAQAGEAELAVFLRGEKGWTQTEDYEAARGRGGLRILVNASGAAQDGEENLLVVCLDPLHTRDLLFDALGRPGERFRLNTEGKRILSGQLRLMCLTLCPDGIARPAPWHIVDDLSVCGPRDQVFVYDPVRETIEFGDGRHGALLMAGSGAVLVTDEALSLCDMGNIPANAGLRFTSDGAAVSNTAARGGQDRETNEEGRARLLLRLRGTKKCLSAADYEARARETPGLRVAGARALPDFDRARPYQRIQACVSVAVLPAGEAEKPMADARFLSAVSRHLEACRSVCIRTEVIPVRYAPFSLSVRLHAAHGTEIEPIREKLRAFFAPSEARIGEPGRQDDVAALLQKLPGVLQVGAMGLRGQDQNSYETAGGDLMVSPDAMLYLERCDVELSFT